MAKQEHRVNVAGGKYTFVIPADDYRVSILRYGDPWHGPQGEASNALHSIMCELDAARVVVKEVRNVLRYTSEGLMPSESLQRALALHDRLTADDEPPSAWCGASHLGVTREEGKGALGTEVSTEASPPKISGERSDLERALLLLDMVTSAARSNTNLPDAWADEVDLLKERLAERRAAEHVAAAQRSLPAVQAAQDQKIEALFVRTGPLDDR